MAISNPFTALSRGSESQDGIKEGIKSGLSIFKKINQFNDRVKKNAE